MDTSETKKEVVLLEENGIKFVEKQFEEGAAKGFKFAVPQVLDINAAIQKYGLENILGIINSYLVLNCRIKVKNAIPDFKKNEAEENAWFTRKQAEKPDLFLFTLDDAQKWIPGEREYTPMGYFKLAKEAKEAGDIELCRKYMKLGQEKMGLE